MAAVTKDVLKAGTGPAVTKTNRYKAMVTLSIEAADGTLTPSGWSTRVEHGAARDEPFAFQPGTWARWRLRPVCGRQVPGALRLRECTSAEWVCLSGCC